MRYRDVTFVASGVGFGSVGHGGENISRRNEIRVTMTREEYWMSDQLIGVNSDTQQWTQKDVACVAVETGQVECGSGSGSGGGDGSCSGVGKRRFRSRLQKERCVSV